jgi:hypothetical protein
MLIVKQLHQRDLDYRLHNLIYSHAINAKLPQSLLAKHYSGTKLAQWLTTDAVHSMCYVLYLDSEPIGLMCFSEVPTVHMDCSCVVEDMLFIAEEHRSIKHLLALVKQSLSLISNTIPSPYLVFVGSTLGPSTLPELYKRIGFSQVGTHLVKEYT